MKRLVGYLLVTLLTLSVSAPLAHSAVKPGSTCKKLNSTSEVGGYRYTCVKLGTKLVWNKGTKLNSTSKTVEPAKEIDYSSCMDERAYSMWKLASSEYSNVAKDYGQAYSARLDKGITNPKFGFDDLTFTNKTPCKVKIQVIAAMQCYGPLGSQAYSYSMQSQTGDIQVSASSTITINVERFFSSSKYSCESKPSQFVSQGMRNNLSGPPYLNFGGSVGNITIKVEGADPAKPYKELPTPTPTVTVTATPTPTPTQKITSYKLGDIGPGKGIIFITPNLFEEQLKGRTDFVVPTAKYYEMSREYIGSANQVSDPSDLVSKYRGGGFSDWFLPSRDTLRTLAAVQSIKNFNGLFLSCLSTTVGAWGPVAVNLTGYDRTDLSGVYICAVRSFTIP